MKYKDKLASVLFYLAIFMETWFVLLDKSNYIIQHETWWFRITFLIFAAKIALTKYEKKEWIGIVMLAAMGIISWACTDREDVIRIVAMAVACKNIDIKKTLKLILYETAAGSAGIIILSLLGIYGEISRTTLYRGGGIEETRYCLGMGHPNALHCMIMMIMLLTFAVYEESLKWWGYAIAVVVNVIAYKLTDSRTGLLVSTAMIAMAVILHYAKNFRDSKWMYIIVYAIECTVIIVAFIAASVGVGTNKFLWDVDMVLNGRLDGVFKNANISTWSLFSNIDNGNTMDMAVAKGFYWYGIIPMTVFFVLLAITVWRCKEKKEYGLLLILVTFLMYSTMEGHAVNAYIGRNYSFLVMGAMLMMGDTRCIALKK